MKKSELRKLIKEELENKDPFIHKDGWNRDFLADLELMEWLDSVAAISYEIKNARRGSYAIEGDRGQDLISSLIDIKAKLGEILSEMRELKYS